MDLVLGRLGERAHHQLVDVDVLRQPDREGDAFGDVLGAQRTVDPRVDGGGPLPVTVEAVQANPSV